MSDSGDELPPPLPLGGGGKKGTKDAFTIEKMYQKKSQLEHILLRPDTYIGSVEKVTESMWVYDTEKETMVMRDITYVPGLYKIFDEILVNAADNKQRDPKMDCIKITIDPDANVVSIWNNGQGIPVVEHKDEKMFVPTMIFGHLLTSSNYNDEEEKVTGGRNGYGAKLCNIFSTKFTVETSSNEYKRAFKQSWSDNMGKASDVKIKDSSSADYTKVTFSPDLSKFKMDKLDKDIVDLMSRRAYDVAASTRGVKVFLNGSRLPVKTFKDYIDLYIKGKEDEMGDPLKVVYESAGQRWEVALTLSSRGFQQVSFVNSIATTKGGRHVDYVADMIIKQVIEQIKKKNKGGITIKPFQIRSHMWVFINCLVVNPTFDSQTKEHMTLQAKNFGSKCVLSEKFMSNVLKSGLVEQVLTWAKFKAQTILERASAGKKKNKIKGVPKLEDANDAGSKNSLNCTLILTEGDSAKTLAVSGLSVVGRDRYGVFPLRGKLLNVREATHKQILENAEINNIIKIMGLQYKKKYETREDMQTLRYGKLMIMTDQDQDGSHIKGLIVNFIHTNWPSLIKMPFLEVFITPLVKVTKRNQELSFFSLPEFEEWKVNTADWKSYKVKYYKGLGTSTSKEAREYFSNMERHRIKFKYSGPECDQHIVMAFSKKCVEERKEWLTNWMSQRKRRKELGLPEEYLYATDTRNISFKDFVNKELVLFSNMDNERSIPSMVDGFKPGQRKVLYTCLKRNDKNEVKVAQLAGSVAEHSAYHHGEVSLMGTIINLAQNYVGSNNINLLQPIGQFGTRLQGGKDSASPRYIFTKLSPLTKLIFHPLDDPLLKYQFEDNQKIEPVWYIPVIPMVLVNGADGIGTGWMTKIPNHNPRDLIEYMKLMLAGEDPKYSLKPWYKGFRGDIEPLIEGKFVVSGEVGILNEEKVEITELPIGTWTQNYKESVLEVMLNGTEKQPALITDFKEYNTDTTVRFVVSMTAEKLAKAEDEGLHKVFKLQTTISLTSMCVFDKDNCLKKFDYVTEMLREFYDLRLEYYSKRKDFMVGMLEAEALKLSNQARFIVEKCKGVLMVENKKKNAMIKELQDKKYASDPVKAWKQLQQSLEEQMAEAGMNEEEDSDKESESSKSSKETDQVDYDYLLGMSLWMLTLEKKEELINKKNDKQAELDALKIKTPKELWETDLANILAKLEEVETKEKEDEEANLGAFTKPKTGKGAGGGGGRKKSMMALETAPSKDVRRILPTINEDLKRKAEVAIKAKERKLHKGKKGAAGEDEKDEFDLLEADTMKSVEARLGNSPELIEKKIKERKKQGKKERVLDSSSPKKKGKKKGGGFTSSEDDFDGSDSSDVFSAQVKEKVQPTRTVARRSAASRVKFNFDDSENSNNGFSSEEEMKPNISIKQESPVGRSVKKESDDSDSDLPLFKKEKEEKDDSWNEKLFDSLLESKTNEDIEITPPKKAAPAKTKIKDLDSDFDNENNGKKAKKVKPPPKKKAKTKTDSEDEDALPKKKKAAPKTTKAAPNQNGAAKKTKTTKAGAKRGKKSSDSSGSDSDAIFSMSKAKSKKKKNNSDSDEEEFQLSDSSPIKPKVTAARRARKPITYKMSDDNSDSD